MKKQIQDLEEKQVKYVCKMRGIQNKTNKKKKGEKRNYLETFDIYDTTTHIYSVHIYKVFQINTWIQA